MAELNKMQDALRNKSDANETMIGNLQTSMLQTTQKAFVSLVQRIESVEGHTGFNKTEQEKQTAALDMFEPQSIILEPPVESEQEMNSTGQIIDADTPQPEEKPAESEKDEGEYMQVYVDTKIKEALEPI